MLISSTLANKTGTQYARSSKTHLRFLKKEHPQITQVSLRSDEAGCYRNNLLLAAVRDAGGRVGIEAARYDFSEP